MSPATLSSLVPADLTLDRTYQRGDSGRRVRSIQEWLSLRGQSVTPDGAFGPATELAVQRFRAQAGLPVNGTVDQQMYDSLTAPIRRALAALPAGLPSLAAAVVVFAQQHLAQKPREVGGQNSGPWVRLYTRGNQGKDWPWCAAFVSFVVRQASLSRGASMPVDYTLSCDTLAADGKRRGTFVPERQVATAAGGPASVIAPGSIFLNRRTPTDWVHTGIVVAVHGDTFESIEGNTNDAGDREGYEVCQRIRGYRSKDFIRI